MVFSFGSGVRCQVSGSWLVGVLYSGALLGLRLKLFILGREGCSPNGKRVREWIRTLFFYCSYYINSWGGNPPKFPTLFSYPIHGVSGKIGKMGGLTRFAIAARPRGGLCPCAIP